MADEPKESSDQPTPVAKIDSTQMEDAALPAAREEQRLKALEALNQYRLTRDPRAYDAAKGHLGNMDGLSEEMVRRAGADDAEMRAKAAFNMPPRNVATMGGVQQGEPADDRSPAGVFLKSAGYQRAREDTSGFRVIEDPEAQLKMTAEFGDTSGYLDGKYARKALITSGSAVGGPFVVPYFDMAFEPVTTQTNDFMSLVSRTTINTDSLFWIQQTARASSAAPVSAATASSGTSGLKPEATITFARKAGIVEVIAETAAVTEQTLADASQMSTVINNDLREDLLRVLNAEMLTGSGTTPHLSGVINAGIQAMAYSTSVPVASANALDNYLHMQVLIITANEWEPDGYVIETVDWESLRLIRATGTGEYLWGPPSQRDAGMLWGLPVVRTNNLTNGTALCGAFRRACRLYEREGIRFTTGYINDDLQRNIIRIRAELRACMTTVRPSAIVQMTGIP